MEIFQGNSKQDGRGPDGKETDGYYNQILDIREDKQKLSLKEMLKESLSGGPSGEDAVTFPNLLLWDQQGLKLFEAITYSEEYYLTDAEIEVLKEYAEAMAKMIAPDTMMVELGSG